ncbi:M10 family metallopeptidase C-terminal domain-containing protein, partial [Zoogloea sp.]|uniref:M10 family metallopeptidase C-terminal domain-containing protein n=1 Tax=Zoogloea sp. TaxID=49181 RepID=UPI0035B09F47
FTLGLSNPSGATLGTASATATIANDDQDIPANTGTAASLAIGGTATGLIDSPDDVDWWRVNLTAGTSYAFRLDGAASGGIPDPLITLFNASGDELDSDDDSGAGLNASLIYTPDTSGTYYLAAEALDGAIGAYVIAAGAAPVLHISAANANRSEGNGGTTPFTFTVTRSGNTDGEVRADWEVEGGTVNETDFIEIFLPGDRITLAPGETTATITVDVLGDALAEIDETFNVRLSGARGAVIGTALASGTIRNDDTSAPRPGIDVNRAALTAISVPAAVDDSIDNLVSSTKWGGAIGTGTTLTYSFADDIAVFNYANQLGGTVIHSPYYGLDSSQQQAARDAMAAFSAVCNLTFVEVDDTLTSAGDIRWIESGAPSTSNIVAWSPGNSANAGDIWLNTTDHYADPTVGSYDYLNLLFSIGYAVGLVQPHLGSPAPEAGEDQLKYSVMSARSYDGAPVTGYSNGVYPVSPMLNDIAALQYLYGANTGNHAGDDVYRWGSDNYIYDTLWDAGGNDTLDAGNQPEGVTFNLNAGSWSSIGVRFSNGQTMVRDNFTIAYGATIENAIGSGFNDTLVGNGAANTLTGNAGADTLTGGAGADSFVFATAADGGDTITDFRSGDGDKLAIRAPNFGLVAGTAAVLRSAGSLPAASGSGGQFLYNTANGQLWFDRDGSGAGTATLLATLANRPTLGASDIQLVGG